LSKSKAERISVPFNASDICSDGEQKHGYPEKREESLDRAVKTRVGYCTTTHTQNSFAPDDSLVVSKAEALGLKVIKARSFLEFFDLNGFDT
jgi:hypothetical protein